jgi:hypothetical protein
MNGAQISQIASVGVVPTATTRAEFFPGVTKAQSITWAGERSMRRRQPNLGGRAFHPARPARHRGQACYPGRTAPGALGRHVVHASADATTAPSAWAASAARSPLYMRRKEARRGGAERMFTLPRKRSGEESKLTQNASGSFSYREEMN